jgi:EAL domain-containing protein (putative c-di-GMP-specific phosphodiesterase class I)/ActR/RegA family two-component response regulator
MASASVAIVDDTPENVALLAQVLRAAGVRDVRTYTDPRMALVECAAAPPDALLVDLHMPHLDGVALLEQLAAQVPKERFLPVIVLTADITPAARQRVLRAGAKDFLTKPFDVTEVTLRVRNLLETAALYRQLEAQNQDLRNQLAAQAEEQAAARAKQEAASRRIDRVLTDGGLSVVLQPIVEISTGAVVGAEALARFASEPSRTPDLWFAEAASVGRGVELELAAIAVALDRLEGLPDGAFLSVNAAPTTVISPLLVELLRDCPRDRIVVELTEHDPVHDYSALVRSLNELRQIDIRCAVDDTGAGYASLEHLLRLRSDILKLDISLTRGIDHDAVRRSLAAALVAFGHDTGAMIIAEGVETPAELQTLRALGVPWAQGYHLARPTDQPLPANVFRAS